ncbi:MAG: TIGR00730 family Rossman fold protein [Elusimicrobia bacterium]|nr:TIGR00730 family Rossman fold protein [Elusimicrobiota bacterium]
MTRTLLAVLLALAPAAPAFAQFRAAPEVAPTIVSPLAGAGAAVASPLTTAPALAGAQAVPSLAPTALSAPSAASLPALPAAAVPSVASGFAAVPASADAASVGRTASGAAATAVPAASVEFSGAASARGADGRPAVLSSLKDLAVLLGDGAALQGARTFDGAGQLGALVDASGEAPSIPQGVRRVEAHPLRSPADVDLIPRLGNSAALHDELRAHLSALLPIDIFVYHDARGGRFLGLDLSRNPDNAGRLPDLQAHEVATIRRIQAVTRDLQVLVREEGATPDLVVRGVPTEMKSVFSGDVAVQVSHANVQLLAHAKRHGLGLGAVALDMDGREIPVERVEAGLAAVRRAGEIGFDRVYAFNGGAWQTYARGVDGEFRLSRTERPFSSHAAPTARAALVPRALALAPRMNLREVEREITEPSRLLRERGIEAIVTAYGSARIASPEAARARLAKAEAEAAASPSAESRRSLTAAREALRMSKYYRIARELGALVAREGGGRVAMVTGGGPGIMEGANRGAFEAGGPSVGFNIILPHEQNANPYATAGLEFSFENFATRKMALRRGAMGLVYFPGGFGTMDELFEVLTLIQTGKMPRVPIVLIGERSYWEKILDFSEFDRMGLISHEDLSMFTFAETAEQAWSAIQRFHAAR